MKKTPLAEAFRAPVAAITYHLNPLSSLFAIPAMILVFVLLFFLGYLAIALEHPLKVDKAASALLLGMTLWVVYAFFSPSLIPALHPDELAHYVEANALQGSALAQQCLSFMLNHQIVEALGDITQTLFFLIGAMTIVEIIDVHEGFSVITGKITTRRKRVLLAVVCAVTFVLSSVLDNLTTTIVMIMLLRKIIAHRAERWLFASMVVVAANTGGAWSPIGDVTTIMLWVKGNVTTSALISFVLLPSIVALLVPLCVVGRRLSGTVVSPTIARTGRPVASLRERRLILGLGIAALIFVPIFKSLTHLPPFIGVLFSLGALWVYTECFYNYKKLEKSRELRVSTVVKRIDMSTILFFFGILMAVSVLQISGILAMAARWLDANVHNVYIINILLGGLSSIVDNVPLVAAAQGMYPIAAADAVGYAANYAVDGTFWEFLSYCAGVGGSLFIIGSAAGVVAMGIEKIPFGWYMRRFTLVILAGYLAGALVYFIEAEFLKGML